MFTGLVTDVGRIASIEDTNGLRRLKVESAYPVLALQMGASVMHSGVCLTVVEFGERFGGSWWVVEAIPETLSRTNLGELKIGARTNLELSLKLGDELGGHLVYGHVDAVGTIGVIANAGDSRVYRVRIPANLSKFFVEKGSVAIDGVSLTVSAVHSKGEEAWFEVSLIPHTLAVTTLGTLTAGSRVNLEVDMLARYVARMLEWQNK
ncbi:MAG TPA: riboflavin synthase [Hyphomonadaceae bacterium]|jgi:riboflavin synthase|nr:riboflavin synthase [Hyphomonadaceae bacterium]